MTACHLQLLLHFPLSPQSRRSSPKTLGSSSTPWRAPLTKKPNYTHYYYHYYPPQNPTCEQRYLQTTDTQTMHNPGQPRISGREATPTIYCTPLEQTDLHTFGTTIKFRNCCSKFKPTRIHGGILRERKINKPGNASGGEAYTSECRENESTPCREGVPATAGAKHTKQDGGARALGLRTNDFVRPVDEVRPSVQPRPNFRLVVTEGAGW
jgi:hypothetical protein